MDRNSCSQEGFLWTPSASGFSLYGKDWMVSEVVWSLVVELMDSFLYLDIWGSRVQAWITNRNHLQSLFSVNYLGKVETTPKVFTNSPPNSSLYGNQMLKHENLWRIFYIQNNGDTYNLCFHPTFISKDINIVSKLLIWLAFYTRLKVICKLYYSKNKWIITENFK